MKRSSFWPLLGGLVCWIAGVLVFAAVGIGTIFGTLSLPALLLGVALAISGIVLVLQEVIIGREERLHGRR